MMMIGRRCHLSCLLLGMTLACFRRVVAPACDPIGLADISSKIDRASLVLDATAFQVPEEKGETTEVPVRFLVTRVLKGRLEGPSYTKKPPTISAGMFALLPNPENCVAPLPLVGYRCFLFLNSTMTSGKSDGKDGNSSEGGAATTNSTLYLITSFPVKFSKESASAVLNSSKPNYAREPLLKKGTNKSVILKSGSKLPLRTLKDDAVFDRKHGSTLLIQNISSGDAGTYHSQAVNLLGKTPKKPIKKHPVTVVRSSSHSVPCEEQTFCLNGGTCMIMEGIDLFYCSCAEGFTGYQCMLKMPPDEFYEDL